MTDTTKFNLKDDLYNIPGDTGYPWRLKKFVEYQHKVPPIHPLTLDEYFNRHEEELTDDDYIWICWILSLSYNEITTLFIWRHLKDKFGNLGDVPNEYYDEFWNENRDTMPWGTARKYVKANNQFSQLMIDFRMLTDNKPHQWLIDVSTSSDPEENYRIIEKKLRNVNNCGRFSVDLFFEELIFVNNKKNCYNIQESNEFDWKHCANLTSGLFNIMYADTKAQDYDKRKRIDNKDKEILTNMLLEVQKTIKETYPEQDSRIPVVVGKICSFRNLFKSARYAGFHHDRQLGIIYKYKENYPDNPLWDECFEIRKSRFSENLLGEVGGWTGIRKERKKSFLTKGFTGAEDL